MRMRSAVGVTALLLALPGTAFAAPSFKLRRVNALNGAGDAVFLGAPKGDSRLFVVDQRGVVRVRSGGRLKTFIDLRSRVESGGERGLLSIAFHPRFASNHRFFVYYTAAGTGDVTIAEGRATGDRGTFRRVLLRIRHREAPNHNGGQLQFGPDGRLWIGTGDGGGAGDHFGHAQDRRSLLGKIIRLNVDAAGARARIWGIGVRNPWRFSFDTANGDLWIGDVGQGSIEEVDHVKWPLVGLLNFGWDVYEGRSSFESKPLGPGRYVPPVAQYPHSEGCSITGGYVYRGSQVPAAKGRYFYGDYCSGTIWSLRLAGSAVTGIRKEPITVRGLTSFGQDAAGELYLVGGDAIYRLAG